MPRHIVVSSRAAAQDGCARRSAALLVAAGSTEFRRWDGQRCCLWRVGGAGPPPKLVSPRGSESMSSRVASSVEEVRRGWAKSLRLVDAKCGDQQGVAHLVREDKRGEEPPPPGIEPGSSA